ncbi:alpha/beta fold hydrolase [Actinokineospora spheciospongiae]|uniref:alpha/beta fold hydrolase n=1 Tax=Actinokineospora spheciospongiae TaxID=909613 RepID=UPI00068BEBCD|nr:alpha/beta hydrolase [Actinokineospora spheciospongiae]
MSTTACVRATDHELEYRGFRFVARTATTGAAATEPLVIIGGSSQYRHSWMRYERQLLEHTSMVTLDLPGYGDSDHLPAEHGPDFLVGAVHHTIGALSLGPVNLFGGCFGSPIALRLAHDHPRAVRRLMLTALTAELTPEAVARVHHWSRMWDAGQFGELADAMVGEFMSPAHLPVKRRRIVERHMRHTMATRDQRALAQDFTHRERLLAHSWHLTHPTVTAPALLIAGEHDTFTPPARGREVARAIGGRFTTVKEADHLLHLERDTELADLMVHFFTDRPLDSLPYLNPVEHPGAASAVHRSSTRTGG